MPRRPWHANFVRAKREYRTSPDGEVFDSVGELGEWMTLKLRESLGEISNLKRQVKFPLVIYRANGEPVPVRIRSDGYPDGRAAIYKLDFQYDVSGRTEYVEFKGSKFGDDEAARLRRAVVEAIYAIQIRVVYSRKR